MVISMWVSNLVIPAGLVLIGGVVALTTGWATQAQQRRAAQETADRAHQRDLRLRWETHELDVLMRTSEALTRLGRANGRANFHDLMVHRTTGKPYGSEALPDEINEELYSAGREVRQLGFLIIDDGVRQLVARALQLWDRVAVTRTEEGANRAIDNASEAQDAAHEAIGARIRNIYRPSD